MRNKYNEFINKILNTRGRFSKDRFDNIKFERHHIVPVCLGGTDNEGNLIDLLPDEHLAAHLLLLKLFPENKSLAFSCNLLRNRLDIKLTNEQFNQMTSSMHHSDETKEKMAEAKLGKKRGSFSDEWKANMSKSWDYSKHFTEKTKKKMSESQKKRWANKGGHHSEETILKMREAQRKRREREKALKID